MAPLRPSRTLLISFSLCGALSGPLSSSPAFGDCCAPLAAQAQPEGPALSSSDLDRLEREMRSGDAKARLKAALTVSGAGSDGYEAYVERLLRPVQARTELLRALIWGIWAQYPNPDYPKGPGKDPQLWFVRPEPKWTPPPREPGKPRAQRPPKHDPDAVDWVQALSELEFGSEELLRDFDAKEAADARADALLRTALLRAIATAGTRGQRDAVAPLFAFAFVRDGLFRDECGRAIRSMGSYAVPALIATYHNRQRTNAKMRRYASYQLDRMDRVRPVKAIGTAPDDLTRAAILHAYGEARALAAVDAVLGQVDAASHRVRREARWAFRRYVDGPPPPPSPKRKRKLPGGQEEAEEKEDYLNYREMATLAIQKAVAEIHDGQAPSTQRTASQLTDELLAYYDQRREAEFSQLFDSAKEREAAGDLEAAVDRFGFILANQPDHGRRAEMAPVFTRLGSRFADEGEARGDEARVSRALGLLRQSLALHPSQPGAARLTARVHYLDGRQAQARGGDGVLDFERAVAADGGFLPARQALEAAGRRGARGGLSWLTLAAALCLFLPLFYLLWRRTGRRGEDLAHPEDGSAAATL